MLHSVGLTNNMMRFECAFYGIRALMDQDSPVVGSFSPECERCDCGRGRVPFALGQCRNQYFERIPCNIRHNDVCCK